jgi:hypothetical protein
MTMIVCLSPEHSNLAETANSIDFGRRARGVQNTVKASSLTMGGAHSYAKQQLEKKCRLLGQEFLPYAAQFTSLWSY